MRLLIIEDEKPLAQSLKKALQSQRFAVDICYTGQEGYETASVTDYDAIILDLRLPDLDGIKICQKLRQDNIKTPILMLTARDTVKDKILGLNSGADDYLVKPFNFNELLARIRSLLRRETGKTQPVIRVNSLVLDTIAKTVTRTGKPVSLSAKEYALLQYLILHADKIVSKEQLIEHVWDDSLDPFSNVVDVYIGYLRNKIDRDFPGEKALIHTLKGRGYKLC